MSKTILITGGTGKVGQQLLNYFSKKGMTVVFTSRSEEKIKALSSEKIIGIKVDFQDNDAVDIIIKTLRKQGLKINYLINNARDLDALKVENDGKILQENWHKEYQIDVVIPYNLTIELAKLESLEKVVNISSMYGVSAFNPNLYEGEFKPTLQYACAKAALIQLTKCLAVLFKDKNISVNCISYGGIDGRVDESFRNRYAKLCPQGRMMKEEETIGAVEFLLSENSTYINGQNLIVDGGWTIW